MPTLDWIGKKDVVNYHRKVPFHLLKQDDTLSVGDPNSGNLLVQGDNLIALKALLPYYAQQVKCIYIDPPYNTGNEGWTYNDAVNSPEMKAWLGKVVGKESEDLSRHDKWLCMMYPRLQLLYQFLRDDGAIFVSIDDNELPGLRMLMDEIFGLKNFITTIIWQKIYTVKNSAKHLSEMHDYILVYARNKDKWTRNLQPRTEDTDEDYRNPDDDPQGPWISNALQSRNFYSKGTYPITCPGGREIPGPPPGTYWRMEEKKFWDLHRKGQVWWGEDGNASPRIKKYLKDAKKGVVPATIWFHESAGTNSEAKTELRNIVGDQMMFTTPKPVKLIKRILQMATDEDSIVLDSFAGSGTTGHAVLALNQEENENRRFILVEMDEQICESVTAVRLQRVVKGYTYTKTTGRNTREVQVDPLGSGFRFCRLSTPLFGPMGEIAPEVTFEALAKHIFFVETGLPLPENADSTLPLLGVLNRVAVYLLFNGIPGDSANILTAESLQRLPPHDGPRVVYADSCVVGDVLLKKENIVFKQIPYEVRVS